MKQMDALGWVVFVLLVVAALNFGILGLTNTNVLSLIFGGVPALERIVYILIGLAGLWKLYKVLMEK